jgi:ganglioside-induced differentiation-associated protein 1
MLTLYHHGSSACAAKVRFALEEKQLRWESRYVDIMKGEQFSPDYTALNPKAVVPTLVHDDAVITESTVICEYIDEVFPERALLPRDPLVRARIRVWTKAVDEELHPACSAVTYVVSHRHTILRNGAGSFEEFLEAGGTEGRAARERKWQWIQQGLKAPGFADQLKVYVGYVEKMDDALRHGDWLVGDRFSMADVAMAPYLFRLSALALEPLWRTGRLERVSKWYDRIRARPSFGAAFERWFPDDLAAEMRANGERAWPGIEALLLGG